VSMYVCMYVCMCMYATQGRHVVFFGLDACLICMLWEMPKKGSIIIHSHMKYFYSYQGNVDFV